MRRQRWSDCKRAVVAFIDPVRDVGWLSRARMPATERTLSMATLPAVLGHRGTHEVSRAAGLALVLALAALAVASAPAAADTPPSCASPVVSAGVATVTCSYTGDAQTWAAP